MYSDVEVAFDAVLLDWLLATNVIVLLASLVSVTMNLLHCPASPLDTITLLMLYGVFCTTFTIVGLFSLWVVHGSQHWFLRTAPMILLAWLASYVDAHDIATTSLVQVFVVASISRIFTFLCCPQSALNCRILCRRPIQSGGAFQFGVFDLLLLAVVVASLTAIGCATPNDVWDYSAAITVLGIGLGLSTLAAAPMIFTKRGLRTIAVELILGGGAIVWLCSCRSFEWDGVDEWDSVMALCMSVWALTISWLAIARLTTYARSRERSLNRSVESGEYAASSIGGFRRLTECALVTATVLIAASPFAVLGFLLSLSVGSASAAGPNGYKDLLEAARQVRVPGAGELASLSSTEKRELLGRNEPAIERARIGLSHPCRVTPEIVGDMSGDEIFEDTLRLCELGRLLILEAEIAEGKAAMEEVLDRYALVLQFFRAMEADGLYVHTVHARSLASEAGRNLLRLRDRLTSKQCRELLDAWQEYENCLEPYDVLLTREYYWLWHPFYWRGRVLPLFLGVTGRRFEDLGPDWALPSAEALLRLFVCHMALHCYYLDKGEYPPGLVDLVPEYVSDVPKDPYSEESLIYHPSSTGYRLHSVGPDGHEIGGGNRGEPY